MSREEKCIFTNMCMICNGDNILVINRADPAWGGITFPGGHVECGESFVGSVIREVREETGLDIDRVKLCGIKQWTHRTGDFRYIVFFFKTDTFSGELRSSSEGNVFWINKKDLKNYTLADGFDRMFEVFDSDELCENYHWFENDEWHSKNL